MTGAVSDESSSETAHLDARCIWIIDGGPNAPRRLPPNEPSCVIAVDRGLAHALRSGLRPHVVVGDFDSVDPGMLARAGEQWPDLILRRHPPDKAHSDLDLALSFAWGLDPDQIAVVSGAGGRIDHLLTSVGLLARPCYAALRLVAYVSDSVVRAATAAMAMELNANDGNLLTLLAVGGTARVQTTGLRWNLSAAMPLRSAASLGLSNEFIEPTAEVRVAAGTVLAVQTHGKSLS
ncbi:thiamine diphosphokinase [Candidatus Poriferisodalis sp.]|uniref:thiamine diphosphokinase n=1 Tax=Candidatus Poriferisodalis sp. TaxID=3101277 RepID=UPI003B01E0FA